MVEQQPVIRAEKHYSKVNPSTPNVLFNNLPYYLLYNSYEVKSENLSIRSTIDPLIYLFLYSQCLSHALYCRHCIDIVRRNSI